MQIWSCHFTESTLGLAYIPEGELFWSGWDLRFDWLPPVCGLKKQCIQHWLSAALCRSSGDSWHLFSVVQTAVPLVWPPQHHYCLCHLSLAAGVVKGVTMPQLATAIRLGNYGPVARPAEVEVQFPTCGTIAFLLNREPQSPIIVCRKHTKVCFLEIISWAWYSCSSWVRRITSPISHVDGVRLCAVGITGLPGWPVRPFSLHYIRKWT